MAIGGPLWRTIQLQQVWRGEASEPSRRPPVRAMKLPRYPGRPWVPLGLAAGFFAIPVTLYALYPISLWSVTDNEPEGLGNALSMAYRLADFQLYPAGG